MSAGVTVRRLRSEDKSRWRELWDGYLSFYRAEVSDEVTDSSFERLCERDGNGDRDGNADRDLDGDGAMVGLVAVDSDDRLIGLAHLIFHPATWTATTFCYLEDLYVDRSLRGSGASLALFDAVYAHARQAGAERVYWHTQQFNGPARSLYDTVGSLTSFVVYRHDL
jgi:GNAT superfamily N-acetyltransferase